MFGWYTGAGTLQWRSKAGWIIGSHFLVSLSWSESGSLVSTLAHVGIYAQSLMQFLYPDHSPFHQHRATEPE